ncbi:hypothetical protein Mal4_09480 [Maioricimonas rarisocia]|uniref:Uncharacterized protein n=1 Tax=Maioricimonas rarisocia TaxID=2528026 RepID=A0A517Z2G4_9PLAN|nr:hypothetical protein [Maioricimonas rarisocia]QDU36660.1 hypothetical protein Mal4_09480 [Maioricimonas rarisocia]
MRQQAAATEDSAEACRPGRKLRCRLAAIAVCLLLPAESAANPYFLPPAAPVRPAPPVIIIPPRRPVLTHLPRTTVIDGPLLAPGEPEPSVLPRPVGNLQVIVSKDLISPLVERNVSDAGPVRDFILGANVFGEQSTNTSVSLVFIPCPDAALFQIELNGRTNNRTVGVTPQATIHSVGEHDFCIAKKVRFDGRQFMTWSPSATVLPRQQNLFAQTPLGGIPLVGPVASNFALSEANRRTPIARNIIALKVTDEAAPRFNEEVDQKLAEANRGLSNLVVPRLQAHDLLPDAFAQTTDRELRMTLRLGAFDDSAPPGTSAAQPAQLTVRLHQTFLNRVFARLPLAGAEVTDADINRAVSQALALVGGAGTVGADATENETTPSLATLRLDDQRPLSVQFGEDGFSLVLRSAFQPVIGPTIDTQEITIPYVVESGVESVRLRPQTISITPARADAAGLNAITEALLRQQVESRIPEITLPRSVELPIPGLPERPLRLIDLQLQNGWLVLAYE